MAVYNHLAWLLCVVAISIVQGKSIPKDILDTQAPILRSDEVSRVSRCGVNDSADIANPGRVRRNAALGETTLKKDSIITYRVVNGPTITLSKYRVNQLVEKAFEEWAPYCGLRFEQQLYGDADIMLSFVNRNHGDGDSLGGPENVLAHTIHCPNEYRSKVHFDDQTTWVDYVTSSWEQTKGITNFYPVALHEIGHALGLHHTNDYYSIMYENYNPYVKSLSRVDKTNMRKLYNVGLIKAWWGAVKRFFKSIFKF